VFESCKRLQIAVSAFATLVRAVVRPLAASSLAVCAAFLLAAPAQAETVQLLPNVTYETGVQFTPHGPVALHIVRGPRPTGLYRLRPVLSNESIVNRETVSSMQRRLATQATSVGVNGDFFSPADGRPSGIMLRDGVLVTTPNPARSSVGVQLDGTLDVRRVSFRGTWRGTGQRRAINFFNKAPGRNGISLFTRDWGGATPRVASSYSVTLSEFPAATPNADITAVVSSAVANAPVGIAPGTAVLVARGNAAARLQAEAAVGTSLTLRLILQPDWSTVSDAIGGGPLLVRDGSPVYRANEAFSTSQLAPRGPRTAIGQRQDGSLLFVATDGRQPGYSVGMTNFELAQTLVRLGAVRGMALDGGGSSTLAFEGEVLNQPSDGRERMVSNALMLQYFGAYTPPPAEQVVSPNGDGVAETQELAYKVVRPSNVVVTLTAPDGTVAFTETSARDPGRYEIAFPPPPAVPPQPEPGQPAPPPPAPEPPGEGRWTLSVSATDDQGLTSSSARRFFVNSTLGFLRAEPARLVLPPRGASTTIRWTQARAARVRVSVRTIDGVLIRVPASRRIEAGEQSVTWNGRQASGRLAAGGRYVVVVEAVNELGTVTLERELTVRRTRPRR
jgi:exopolysaccharide biosynthesis protein